MAADKPVPEVTAAYERYTELEKKFINTCWLFYKDGKLITDKSPLDLHDNPDDWDDVQISQTAECNQIEAEKQDAYKTYHDLDEEYGHPPLYEGGGSGGDSGGGDSGEGETSTPEDQFKDGMLAHYEISSVPTQDGITSDDVFEAEAFWILKDPGFENDFLAYLNECKAELNKCIDAEDQIKSEITKWINIGTEFNMKLATMENVNMADGSDFNRNENLFDKMKETKGLVSIFTNKMAKSIEIADKIKTEYPESYVGRQNLCYRDLICNWMDMKGRCENIYDNIKSALEMISDNVVEVDDSDDGKKKYINYFNYYQQKDGNQDNCPFNKTQESTDGNTITIQDDSGNVVLDGKKVQYCSEIINGISTTEDNKIIMTVPDASGYRATVLCKIACSFKTCPKKGEPS